MSGRSGFPTSRGRDGNGEAGDGGGLPSPVAKEHAEACAGAPGDGAPAQSQVHRRAGIRSVSATTTYRSASVDGVDIFYREAGPRGAPTVVLLHGFPSSSRCYDALIPLLATQFHVLAPDYPGFGHSEAPALSDYDYSFDQLARSMTAWLEQLGVERYAVYLHDYGAPVGMRMVVEHPQRVRALIFQNGNIYEDGLGAKWARIADYWADPAGHPEVVDAFLSYAATKDRHVAGSNHPERYSPDTWTDEYAHLTQPGQREIQEALLYDYRSNVASYGRWQAWLREHRPPTLVTWGANDPSFIAPGALAFKRDLPDAEVHLLDAGHFALDEATDEIATLMLDFLKRHVG